MRNKRRALLVGLSCLFLAGLLTASAWYFQLGPFQPRWIDAGGMPLLTSNHRKELVGNYDSLKNIVEFSTRSWDSWGSLHRYMLAKLSGPFVLCNPKVYGTNEIPIELLETEPYGRWLESQTGRMLVVGWRNRACSDPWMAFTPQLAGLAGGAGTLDRGVCVQGLRDRPRGSIARRERSFQPKYDLSPLSKPIEIHEVPILEEQSSRFSEDDAYSSRQYLELTDPSRPCYHSFAVDGTWKYYLVREDFGGWSWIDELTTQSGTSGLRPDPELQLPEPPEYGEYWIYVRREGTTSSREESLGHTPRPES